MTVGASEAEFRVSQHALLMSSGLSNQLRSRELNEQLYRERALLGEEGGFEVRCECQRRECSRRLQLARAEYDAVRCFPTRFVLKPGHSLFPAERVVEDHGRFVVVEHAGPTARAAIRLDPRRRHEHAPAA